MKKVEFNIPPAFADLLESHRYKVYYGGRGGAKSHNFARCLLFQAMQGPLRILCARELQNSIGDSVHRLLADIISNHNLEPFFQVQKAAIKGINGSEFIFKGLKYNATEIKSTEGIDRAWVEEAEKVSDASWEMLIPTVRKPGSEIWVSFNTKNVTDPTYQRFVVNQNDSMLVRKVSWRDNPFFPEVLDKERIDLQGSDPEAYGHVWEGEPDTRRSGAIYAKIIDKVRKEGRITKVPYQPGCPVITAWDLGKRHATAILFAQTVGRELRIFDYIEARGQEADVEKLAGMVLQRDYLYDMHWLPHDGKHERLGMKGSISSQLTTAGLRNRILPNISKSAGIEMAKNLLKVAYFDKEKTVDCMHALECYHYEFDEIRQTFKTDPFDDWSADAADAFRYLAIALEQRNFGKPEMKVVHKQQAWSPI